VKKVVLIGIIALATVVVDEILKYIALTKLPSQGSFVDTGWFSISLYENQGIAFSLPLAQNITIVITVILLGVFGWMIYKHWRCHKNLASASMLIMLGALGNFYDRLIYGFTVDYLIFFERSAINLSDILILSGVVWLLLANKRIKKPKN
jgi:signal peptidase II